MPGSGESTYKGLEVYKSLGSLRNQKNSVCGINLSEQRLRGDDCREVAGGVGTGAGGLH